MPPRRKTNEEFLKEVYNLVGDEYTFFEEYKNAITKIRVKHNYKKCNNYEYMVSPNGFTPSNFSYNKNRCPHCSRGYNFTKTELILKIQEKAKVLNRTPYLHEMKNPSGGYYVNVFNGSWNNALKEAGLTENLVEIKSRITNKEIIEMYKQLYNKLGRKITIIDIKRAWRYGEMCSMQLISSRFDGLQKLVDSIENE